MPEIGSDNLWDRCVLLAAGSYNRYGRIQTTDVPKELACRWVENVQSAGGGTADTAAVVATVYVEEDVDLSSVLWRGNVEDFPGAETVLDELVEVSNFHSVDADLGRSVVRWCDVVRFRAQLPDSE